MVRISKQEEIKGKSPKRCRAPAVKTGPKKEAASFNPHVNALESAASAGAFFIPKIK